jgi:vacuolar-type H+-ATPase subunit I/STV1
MISRSRFSGQYEAFQRRAELRRKEEIMADSAGGQNLQIALSVAGALGLGTILGKIVEAYHNKRKSSAETDKTEAETDRTEAETAKLRAETDALIRAAVAAQVQFILDDHTKQREMDRRTIAEMGRRIETLETELKKVETELRYERGRQAKACIGCEKLLPFGVTEE